MGKTGVAIDSVEDMERLFEGIPLDQVSTSMTINATAPILLLLYELVGEEQGARCVGALGHGSERSAEGVRRARDVHLPAEAVDAPDHRPVRLLRRADPEVEHDLDQRLPHARGRCDGRAGDRVHARERHRLRAGGDRRRAEVDDFAPRLSFFFACHMHFFEEVAKFRAARRMWARIMRERFGAARPAESWRSASTRRPAARPSPRSSPRTTSCGRRSRPSPRCSAARSPSTPTASTRRSPCRRSTPRRSPCGPSRSSATSPASRRHRSAWRVVLP